MLSNYVATYPVIPIQRKSKATDKKAEIDCPAVVKQYNKFRVVLILWIKKSYLPV